MASNRRSPSSAQLAPTPHPPGDQTDRSAKLEMSANNERARERAKQDVASRNEQAHKQAKLKLAAREQLRRDLRKGLEY